MFDLLITLVPIGIAFLVLLFFIPSFRKRVGIRNLSPKERKDWNDEGLEEEGWSWDEMGPGGMFYEDPLISLYGHDDRTSDDHFRD